MIWLLLGYQNIALRRNQQMESVLMRKKSMRDISLLNTNAFNLRIKSNIK